MAADDASCTPPRRPGSTSTRHLRITTNVRWGLALLGLALILAALLALGLVSGEATKAVGRAAVVTFLLGASALAHAAHSAWRGRVR